MTPTPLPDLRAAIMNLPCNVPRGYPFGSELCAGVYRQAHRDARHAAAELALSAVPFNPPEGWKLVPIEPTPEMLRAGVKAFQHAWASDDNLADWRAFYKAATADQGLTLAEFRKQWAAVISANGRPFDDVAASPQPVRGEALPAEQPKSDKSNLESASGGNDLQTALPRWEPIETAPRDREVLFWIRPKTADESYTDTSGNPILSGGEPHIKQCRFKCWPSLWTATHWMEPLPLPLPPGESAEARPSNKKAPESSSAAPVEAVEVLRAERDEWARKATEWRRLYSELRYPGMTNTVHAVAQPPQAVQEDERDAKRLDWLDARRDTLIDCFMQDGKLTYILRHPWGAPIAHGNSLRAAVDAAIAATTEPKQ